MRAASAASVTLHAAFLAWMTFSFNSSAFDTPPTESLPVDLVSVEDFTKLTKGAKDAPKKETPAPQVEKKDEPKPKAPEETKSKVTEKQEVMPQPAAKPPEPKPEPEKKAEAKPEPKLEQKPDPIGEKLAKAEETKPDPKPKPQPPKKPPAPKQQQTFDANRIAALLDKRDPSRRAATGETLNNSPSLGASSGSDKRLSASEIDALKARLRQCWTPPVGAMDGANLYVVLRVMFRPDGTMATNPTVVEGPASQMGPALGESATRALFQCQPYTMLRRETYDSWKDMEIKFDPREMFGRG